MIKRTVTSPSTLTFCIPFVCLVIFLRFVTMNGLGATGDEPHYLLITYSFVHDGDFDLSNNYQQHDADAWFPGLEPAPHAFDYKGNGKLYSAHGIGLGVLLVPALILMPRQPVLAGHLSLVFVTAITIQQTFLLCLDLFRKKWLARLTLAIMLCCVPVLFMSNQIYPDVPAALLTIIAARALFKLPKPRAALILGVALALMPWFHVRYIPIAATIGLIGLVRVVLSGHRKVLFFFVTPLVLSALVFVGAYLQWYGNPLANAQYSHLPHGTFSVSQFLNMLVAVAWDREVGFIPVAPIFLIALTGMTLAILGKNTFMKFLLTVVLVYFIILVYSLSANIATWGTSYPWRFMFPVLPLLVLFMSYVIDTIQPVVYLALPLLIVSLAICLLAAGSPKVFYPTETGILPVSGLNRVQQLLPSMYYKPFQSIAAIKGENSTGQVTSEDWAKVVCAVEEESQPGLLSWGIRGGVMPGEFQATFSIKASGAAGTDLVGFISLLDNTTLQTVVSKELLGADFPVPDKYESFVLSIKTDRANVVGTLVQYAGRVELCLEKISFEQVSSTYPASSPYLAVIATTGAVIVGLNGGAYQRKKR